MKTLICLVLLMALVGCSQGSDRPIKTKMESAGIQVTNPAAEEFNPEKPFAGEERGPVPDGIPGFKLGETISAQYRTAEGMYMGFGTNIEPFESQWVMVNDERKIWQVGMSWKEGLDTKLFLKLKAQLLNKYGPAISTLRTDFMEKYQYGTSNRTVTIRKWDKGSSELVYEAKDLRSAVLLKKEAEQNARVKKLVGDL